MRNWLSRGLLVSTFALAGCAAARPPGSPPDTEVSVLDPSGSSLPGEYNLIGASKDSCTTSMSSCAVTLPEGDYLLSFAKSRFGRFSGGGSSHGGGTTEVANGGHAEAGGETKATHGCLRAHVHLTPGVEIVCKQIADFNCSGSATETMDCGPAGIAAWNAHHPAAPATPATAPAPHQ